MRYVRCNLYTGHARHNEFRGNDSFGLSDILRSGEHDSAAKVTASRHNAIPEEKLSVQVADIYRVHVDDMDVLESGKSEVGQDLTSKTTSTNDKNLATVSQKALDLITA